MARLIAERMQRGESPWGDDDPASSSPEGDGDRRSPSGREFIAALTMEVMGEPPGFLHPVNWMGRAIWLIERLAPRSGKWRQLLYGMAATAFVPTFFTALAWWTQRRAYGRGPTQGLAASASLLKSTFAVRALAGAAGTVRDALQNDDIDAAREALRSLVARPTADLTPGLIASAAVESVAENTTDSFIAPWLYYAVGGVPAAFFYRAVNTLDSRIGYRDAEYRYLGWATAKLDDALNLVPSRVAALLIVAAAFVLRKDARSALRTMRNDRRRTASPNAGWTMGAMAGAMGARLEKRHAYRLGRAGWRRPTPQQIGASTRMMYVVAALGAALVYALLALRGAAQGERAGGHDDAD